MGAVGTDGALALGIDVGGTKTAIGLVDETGGIVRQQSLPTRTSPRAGLSEVAEVVGEWRDLPAPHSVGLVVPGLVSNGMVRAAANLGGWVDEPLDALLTEVFASPAVVANDAQAAAWGEYVHGAAGGPNLVALTLGTGLGGGLVLGGRPYLGEGFAGEVGHVRLVEGGRVCACGQRGCWERYSSGSAVVLEVLERMDRDGAAPTSLPRTDDAGPEITARTVVAHARAGDSLSLAAVEAVGRRLGEGLAALVNVLDPTSVVIGGGLAAAADLLLPPARSALEHGILGGTSRRSPRLRVARLGAAAGMVGAAALARAGGIFLTAPAGTRA